MTPAADVFALLRGALEAASVRYAIGGSWASTAFGEPRLTNDVDILAGPPATFFADPEGIVRPIGAGRPFNVIYMPMAFKLDFFPASAFSLGIEELNRAVWMANSGLSEDHDADRGCASPFSWYGPAAFSRGLPLAEADLPTSPHSRTAFGSP